MNETWVCERAALLRSELLLRGWELDAEPAQDAIRRERSRLALAFRIKERSAQPYLSDELISDLADALTEDHPAGPSPSDPRIVPAQ